MLYEEISSGKELQEIFKKEGYEMFTLEACKALVEAYEDINIELNLEEIHYYWIESSLNEIIDDYNIITDEDLSNLTDDEVFNRAYDYLSYRTYAVPLSNGNFLFRMF